MKPAAFDYHRPRDLQEALTLLAQLAKEGVDARVIAGGQSLAPMLNMRLAQPQVLVDINALQDLAQLREHGQQVEVGALVRHAQVAASPLLRESCPILPVMAATIGHYVIRQRGSFGGSLSQADPAAQMVLAAITLDAQIVLRTASGERCLPAAGFLLSPMETALKEGELLVAARFPKMQPGDGFAYRMFNRRRGDYALAAVAVVLGMNQGKVTRLQLGVAQGTQMPRRYPGLESKYLGQAPGAAWADALAQELAGVLDVEDHGRVPADYLRELVTGLAGQALTRAANQNQGRS